MRHGFARVWTVVDDKTVASFEPSLFGNFSRFEQQVTKHLMIFRLGFSDTGNRFFWNNQDMDWSFRANVLERENEIVLVNDLRRNLASDDFFKKCFTHLI